MSNNDMEAKSWPERLQGDADERNLAIEDLRCILLRGLNGSLPTRYSGGLQAEDIVQDALIKILDSLESFRNQSRFTTWAMTIATRVGISELRRKHYRDVSLDAMIASEGLSFDVAVDDAEPVDRKLRRSDVLTRLRDLISSELTKKQQIAIRAQLDGLPVEEIARRTGSNRNAVYKLIHDARVRLEAGLERAGVMAEDVRLVLE